MIIQEEAAKKFAGLPYGQERQYSLLLKPWFELKFLYKFRQTDFSPIPKVKIVLLQIKKRGRPLVQKENGGLYKDFIIYSFNRWRPNLKEGLKEIFTQRQFKKTGERSDF